VKTTVLTLIAAVSFVVAACGSDSGTTPPTPTPASEVPTDTTVASGAASTALEGSSMAMCVESYTMSTLPARTFAFDGTITAITPTDDPVYVNVTFEVSEWFTGDGAAEATVGMFPAGTALLGGPEYEVGTRLLVTGEPRFDDTRLEDLVAWYCGFTRTYDDATAAEWRAALS